ncbi:hypothetical protein DBR00_01180 [Pseudomonas sp. HMWF032]|nr:hypothetical protein DBR00_01180 [Pseudomonas sp. HMWF032]PTT84485.1 hypothetical protein DBR41_07445 [Pseudomonas sp. HMWF010]
MLIEEYSSTPRMAKIRDMAKRPITRLSAYTACTNSLMALGIPHLPNNCYSESLEQDGVQPISAKSVSTKHVSSFMRAISLEVSAA